MCEFACVCEGRLTCTASRPFPDGEAEVTVTDERALCIFTLPAQTDVWIQLTLIHI